MALFQHCSVLFELKGLPFKEKRKIKLAVTDNGGKISFVANKECSLIVTSDVSSLSPSRLRNIVKHQIPVVGLNYVLRCVEADCRLPVVDFKLDISSANDLPAATKEKWSRSRVTSTTSKGQAKPLKAVRAESPKRRGSVIENYRVYNETDRGLPTFPESFQVAKYSLFQKSNGRSWCLLELQSAKSERKRKYRLVRYWKDDIQSKKAAVRDQMVFVSTSEEAVKVFQALTDSVKADGLKQQSHGPPSVTEMGSAPLQQLLLEEKLHTGALSPEVGQFVELLWQEALGCIDLILNTPVHKISLNDVTRAEGILLQVQRKIMENKSNEQSLKQQSEILLTEYCSLLPQRSFVGPDMSSISKQFDLCQLIRDILNVSEMTLRSTKPSSVGKYRALRCSIEAVPKDCSEFEAVTSLLEHSKVQVHQILRVKRAPELQTFKSELGNIKTLLHSSRPHNFVGILSRGLLMPCVAVSEHGIQRTDAGDLGSGIYFSGDMNTTLKYSQCSLTDGSRFVLVCDVALGQCKDLHKKDLTLAQAPKGHESVHGVRNAPGLQSEFMDDEYVVYSPDQVRVKYVVRLNLEGEELKNFIPEIVQIEESSPPDQAMGEVEDGIGDIKNPLDNVTAGLLNNSGQQIPLQAVHVKCKLLDLLAQVIIFQTYTNESSVPIEAKYVFPLDDSAAVCGFEAFINGKHVVGQVKEKETARREYKQAIEKGHGAYLMDQDAPDVFTISVGNLPPAATVLIKVTFVSELIVKDGSVFFSLPSSVAPWQESAALNQTTQVTVEKVCVTDEGASTRDFNLDMSIEMPHKITEVKCITHQVNMKKTDCKAVVSVLPGEVMGPEGFQLLVTLTEVHVPRMWVEQHPNKDSQACMLVFYPKFEATSSDTSDEVVLLLDASQSMKGESLNSARMIALHVLNTLDHNIPVNVIFFGTDHTDAFLSARPIDEARQETKNFIKHFSSAGGSTELWRPLRALSLLPPSTGTRNLLLLSDGHIQNTELTLQLLRDHAPHTRLFTCGLSSTANRHMLRALAQAGGGAYEFFDSKSKHIWSEKVASQVKRMQAPGANSVSVKWQQFNPTAPPPVQAPKQLHALFNDCHTLVFGFVPHCTKATLLGDLSGQEFETMVSTSELQKTKGTFLHKLTARAIIRDFEDGSLDSNAVLHEEKKAELKSFVIELSKEFSILSQFTSFVAIEERDSEEEKGFTDIPKLIAEEDVDFLPYMSWATRQDLYEELVLGRKKRMSSIYSDDMFIMLNSEEECMSFFINDNELMSLSARSYEGTAADELMTSMPLEDLEETEIPVREKMSVDDMGMDMDMEGNWTGSDGGVDVLADSSVTLALIPVTETASLFPPRAARKSAPALSPQGPMRFAAQSLKTRINELTLKFSSDSGIEKHPPPPVIEQQSDPYAEHKFKLSSKITFGRSDSQSHQTPPPPPPPALRSPQQQSFPRPQPRKATYLKRRERLTQSSDSGIEKHPPSPVMDKRSGTYTGHKLELSNITIGRSDSQSHQTPPPLPPPALLIEDNYMDLSAHSTAITQSSATWLPPAQQEMLQSFPQSYSFGQTPHPPPPPPPGLAALSTAKQSTDMAALPAEDVSIGMMKCNRQPHSYSRKVKRRSDKWLPPPPLFAAHDIAKPSTDMAALPAEDVSFGFLDSIHSDSGTLFGSLGSAQLDQTVVTMSESGIPQSIDKSPGYECMGFASNTFGSGGFGGRAKGVIRSREDVFDKAEEMESYEPTSPGEKFVPSGLPKSRRRQFSAGFFGANMSKWPRIFSLQHPEGYWELTPALGGLLNCELSRFADDFLKRKGITSLGVKAHADILKLLATLLVLQLMRLEKLMVGQLLHTLFCLEDSKFRPDHWEAVDRAVKWARWADRQYPCVYSRLEFGLSWDSSTKQLLGAERIHHCSPLTGLNLNPRPTMVL